MSAKAKRNRAQSFNLATAKRSAWQEWEDQLILTLPDEEAARQTGRSDRAIAAQRKKLSQG